MNISTWLAPTAWATRARPRSPDLRGCAPSALWPPAAGNHTPGAPRGWCSPCCGAQGCIDRRCLPRAWAPGCWQGRNRHRPRSGRSRGRRRRTTLDRDRTIRGSRVVAAAGELAPREPAVINQARQRAAADQRCGIQRGAQKATCDQCVTRRPLGPSNCDSRSLLTCTFANYIACGRGDSNPHARRHQILNLAWLPGYTTPARRRS